jgi:DNA-binding NtrC family response regulator
MKVLCLDDDVVIARMVGDIVAYLKHEPVVESSSYDAVIRHARAGFGAAIVDLLMPRLNGVEVLAAFMDGTPECRRVLLTAAPDEPEVREAVAQGIVQLVITKPPNIGDIRLAVAWLK